MGGTGGLRLPSPPPHSRVISGDRRKGRANAGGNDGASLGQAPPGKWGKPQLEQVRVLPAASGEREFCNLQVSSRELKTRGTHERLEAG